MISNPTNNNPFSTNEGPTSLQIHISLSDNDLATAEAPAARLPLSSPSAGILAIAADIGCPLTKSTRLSPSEISGIYSCIMTF